MTESQTGPADRAGQPGGSGMTQTTAPQTPVPQQLGYQQERVASDMDTSGHDPGMAAISAAARGSWGAVLLGGIGMVALGIALLVWPSASLTVVAILIGAALLVSGFVRLVEGFTAHGESGAMRTAYVIVGLLAVVAGVYCVRHHALSLFLVAFVTGVYFIMHGIADIGVALTANVPDRVLRGVLGVVSLAAGILMIVWPGITLVLLLTLVAAWLIFYGLMLAAMSFSLRRAAKATANASAPPQRLATSTG
jgi:uncharacterized membrane protein HdeD (DUF308 family)